MSCCIATVNQWIMIVSRVPIFDSHYLFPLSAVEHLFRTTTLDVSRYAVELVGSIAASFASSDEKTRAFAAQTFSSVITKTSDSSISQSLLDALVAVLDGKSGKLTHPEHRVNLFSCFPAFISAPLSTANKNQLVSGIVDKLLSASKNESHEPTAIAALELIGELLRPVAIFPPNLKAFFKVNTACFIYDFLGLI